MSTFQTPSEYHVWFDSLAEMEAEMPAMIERCNSYHWRESVMNRYDGKDWFGCANAQEAMRYVRDGWPELLKRLQPKIDVLRSTLALDTTVAIHTEVRRRKRTRSDHGDSLDMHRVWAGDLDRAWERPVRFPRMAATQRYATIYADCAVSSMTTVEETLWRAAAIYCMLEMLTRMSVNTEVWSGASGQHVWPQGPRLFWSGVKVKSFTQPLNEDRLATMFCTVFYRTWIFGTYMAAPWRTTASLGMLYGSGLVKPLLDRKEAGERVFRLGNCLNEYSAQAEIQRVIKLLQKTEEKAA